MSTVQRLTVTVKNLGWKDSPIPIFPPSGGCIFTQAKNEEKWRPVLLRAITAAARGPWLWHASINLTFHPRNDETGESSYYGIPMPSGDGYLHLDKPIAHSPEACAALIKYFMDCGAPIESTYDDAFDKVGTIEAHWVPNSKAITACYNQLIALMASYNTQMYNALGAEIPSIAVSVDTHFGKNELNEFAGIVMLRQPSAQ